jgi:glutamate synthase (NADPH/NADH) large chain
MFLVDTEAGRILDDDEIKNDIAVREPWGQWSSENEIVLEELPWREHIIHTAPSVHRRQKTFGYTEEEVRVLIAPLAQGGAEPLGAMGSDTPVAVLSDRPRLLFDYFTQQFAQVTNPPLDSIREEIVTSLHVGLGPERNLLDATPEHARQVFLRNTDTVVLYHQSGFPVCLRGPYADFAVRFYRVGVFDSIAEQIVQYGLQLHFVADKAQS